METSSAFRTMRSFSSSVHNRPLKCSLIDTKALRILLSCHPLKAKGHSNSFNSQHSNIMSQWCLHWQEPKPQTSPGFISFTKAFKRSSLPFIYSGTRRAVSRSNFGELNPTTLHFLSSEMLKPTGWWKKEQDSGHLLLGWALGCWSQLCPPDPRKGNMGVH